MTAKMKNPTKGRTRAMRCSTPRCGGPATAAHFRTDTHRNALRRLSVNTSGVADEKRIYHLPSAAREDAHWEEEAERAARSAVEDRAAEMDWLIEHGPRPDLAVIDYAGAMAQITLRDAAGRLGVKPGTLRMAIHRQRMVGHKLGRDWLVEESEVRHYEMMSLGRPGWPKGRSRKSA